MSTDWRVFCVACNEDSSADYRDPSDANDVILAAPNLLAIVRLGIDLEARISYRHVNLSWLVAHQGHRLGVRSEYGEVWTGEPK